MKDLAKEARERHKIKCLKEEDQCCAPIEKKNIHEGFLDMNVRLNSKKLYKAKFIKNLKNNVSKKECDIIQS